MAKKEDIREKLVFDDDTDDSDDDLETFRNTVSNTVSSQLAPASDSESETNEGGIVHDEEESDTDSSEASEGSDQESEESETEKINREKANTVINNKLGKLSSLLATKNKEESKSSSEEEESEDESDSENEDKSESEEDGERTKNINKSIEVKDKKEQTSDNDEDCEKGKYVKLSKRKIDEVEADRDQGETEQQQEEPESEINKEEEARRKYRDNLSKLPVQQILEIKAKLGDKIFNSNWADGKPKKLERSKMKPEFKRADKNRPREMSSKFKVPAFEKAKQVNKPERRDPRFDPLCGEFDKKNFRRQYGFVKDFKKKELVILKEQLKDAQGEERSKIKYLIQRMENQLRSQRDLEEKEKKAFDESKNMKEKLGKGEKPIYKNKKTIREDSMVEKYERLKKEGKLDKYIMKKSKQNTAKDRKLFGDLI